MDGQCGTGSDLQTRALRHNSSEAAPLPLVIMIKEATKRDHQIVEDIWWHSVQATHHFIPKDYLFELKAYLQPKYLPELSIFLYYQDGNGMETEEDEGTDVELSSTPRPVAFIALSSDKIELLFVEPKNARKGIGRRLLMFAYNRGIRRVDVYEANEQALRFYLSNGFLVQGRDQRDSLGRPFPILHLIHSSLLSSPISF